MNNDSVLSEKKLIEYIKNSDPDAFKTVFHQYYQMLYGYFFSLLQDSDLAKDIIQEVFIRLWQHRNQLQPDLSLKAYLFRIGTNLIIDHRRRKSSQTVRYEQLSENEIPTSIQEISDFNTDLHLAIERLPENLRIPFQLNRFEGFKYLEIATILNLSVKAVEKRMSQALLLLRELLRRND